MASISIRPPKSMLEIWEALPEGTLCQLINNKLVMSPAPKDIHQVVLNRINVEIFIHLKKTKTGEVRIAPYDVYFSKQNILQPNIIFILKENLSKIEDKGLVGAPDIVIEIISSSTFQMDYEEKKSVYEKFGVKEYFIVDPDSKSVDSFFLTENQYQENQPVKAKIQSKILGTEILF